MVTVLGMSTIAMSVLIFLTFLAGTIGLQQAAKRMRHRNDDFFTAFATTMAALIITFLIFYLNTLYNLQFLLFSGIIVGLLIQLPIIRYIYDVSWSTATSKWANTLAFEVLTIIAMLILYYLTGWMVIAEV